MKKVSFLILFGSISMMLQAEVCNQQYFEQIANMQVSPKQKNKKLEEMIQKCLQDKTELENENNDRSFAMTSICMICILTLQLVSLSQ